MVWEDMQTDLGDEDMNVMKKKPNNDEAKKEDTELNQEDVITGKGGNEDFPILMVCFLLASLFIKY